MHTPASPPAPPRELSLELDTTFAEQMRASRAAQRHGLMGLRQIRTQQRVGAVLGAAIGAVFLYADDRRINTAEWVLLAVIVALILSPLAMWLHVRRLRREAGGPARITLAGGGIEIKDARGGNRLGWGAVREVRDDGEFLFFDLGEANGFFIPLRVLRERGMLDEARALVAAGRAGTAGAGAAPPPEPPVHNAPAGPAVAAEFRLTLWEQFAAGQQVWFRSRQGRWITFYLIGVPLLLLALFRWALGPQGVRDNLYLLVGGATLALGIIPVLSLGWTVLVRLARTQPARVTLDGAGLTYTAPGASATVAWPGIRRVQQAGGMLLFWTDRNTALHLPLRALGGAAEEARRIIRDHAGERARL